MLTCYDSFGYPTLTEWKEYEQIECDLWYEEFLIKDDTDNKRTFPMKLFFRNDFDLREFVREKSL